MAESFKIFTCGNETLLGVQSLIEPVVVDRQDQVIVLLESQEDEGKVSKEERTYLHDTHRTIQKVLKYTP